MRNQWSKTFTPTDSGSAATVKAHAAAMKHSDYVKANLKPATHSTVRASKSVMSRMTTKAKPKGHYVARSTNNAATHGTGTNGMFPLAKYVEMVKRGARQR